MEEKINLNLQTFSTHGQELLKNLMETEDFSDVTLISDDIHQYRVHKFILSACSTVFRKILISNPLNSSIYLRGVHHVELEFILQFFYLGEVTFNHERMNEFLNVAKALDIKEIGKYVVGEDKDEEVQKSNHKEQEKLKDTESFEQEELDGSQNHESAISRSPKRKNIEIDSGYVLINGDIKPYKCKLCDYQAARKDSFRYHKESKHQGIRYPCQQCDFKAITQSRLTQHIKSMHEGVKYPCQQCDYQATRQNHLRRHIEVEHEGIKHSCQYCDYQAKRSDYLKLHIKFKHK